MLTTALLAACAILLDRLLGEPRGWHPLVAFGRYAAWVERRLNRGATLRLRGVLAWGLTLVPFVAVIACLWRQPVLQPVVGVLILYFTIGMQSLREHAERVGHALQENNLADARQRVGEIVSRDTNVMQPRDVARAGVESVLENGNDAVFGALFWFALLGAPGALLYRLANTLDAMWGYRTPRFVYFGWAAARLDDVLNYVPARLTALSYALLGCTRTALRCWREQAHAWDSPNAGPVMASGAGSLCLQLGGAAQYHGATEPHPPLGAGSEPGAGDIRRAVNLVERAIWLWLVVFLALGVAARA